MRAAARQAAAGGVSDKIGPNARARGIALRLRLRRPWATLSVHAKLGRLFLFLLAAMLAIFAADVWFGIPERLLYGCFVVVAVALSVLSFIAVKCPRCHQQIWRGGGPWFPPRRCPRCGLETRKAA